VSSCVCYHRVFWLFPLGLIAGWHRFQLAHQMVVYGCGFVRICTSLGVRSRHRRPMSKKKETQFFTEKFPIYRKSVHIDNCSYIRKTFWNVEHILFDLLYIF
jgi:hypothetical protein